MERKREWIGKGRGGEGRVGREVAVKKLVIMRQPQSAMLASLLARVSGDVTLSSSNREVDTQTRWNMEISFLPVSISYRSANLGSSSCVCSFSISSHNNP